jgi:hypothetical protein
VRSGPLPTACCRTRSPITIRHQRRAPRHRVDHCQLQSAAAQGRRAANRPLGRASRGRFSCARSPARSRTTASARTICPTPATMCASTGRASRPTCAACAAATTPPASTAPACPRARRSTTRATCAAATAPRAATAPACPTARRATIGATCAAATRPRAATAPARPAARSSTTSAACAAATASAALCASSAPTRSRSAASPPARSGRARSTAPRASRASRAATFRLSIGGDAYAAVTAVGNRNNGTGVPLATFLRFVIIDAGQLGLQQVDSTGGAQTLEEQRQLLRFGCTAKPAKYSVKFGAECRALRLVPIYDECAVRRELLFDIMLKLRPCAELPARRDLGANPIVPDATSKTWAEAGRLRPIQYGIPYAECAPEPGSVFAIRYTTLADKADAAAAAPLYASEDSSSSTSSSSTTRRLRRRRRWLSSRSRSSSSVCWWWAPTARTLRRRVTACLWVCPSTSRRSRATPSAACLRLTCASSRSSCAPTRRCRRATARSTRRRCSSLTTTAGAAARR